MFGVTKKRKFAAIGFFEGGWQRVDSRQLVGFRKGVRKQLGIYVMCADHRSGHAEVDVVSTR